MAVGARLLTPLWATLTVTLLCVAYLYGSVELFGSLHVWPPLVVPLLLQAPFTLFVAVVLHQRQAARDYQLIHREFSRYLPDIAINRLVHEGFHPTRNRATLFGVCLFTDAEGYTSVAETMDSYALSTVEEEYKHTITQVIVDQRGNISDAHGDNVLAFWASRLDELSIRDDACRTVTKIHDAVEQWNEHNPYGVRFPTRIGLHCGELTLTRIGSETSYESRLVGDIVNTASRLEQLNKQLGTQQLVSAATLAGIDNVVSQYVGAFVFKGKSQPVPVHRLLGWGEEVRERWTTYRQYFAAGLHAFANADWTLAHEYFSSILTFREQDGPCLFYLKQIEQRRSLPLQPGWNGTIVVDQKLSGAE